MKSNFALTPIRIALVALVVLGIGAAVVVASTTVTVTKSSSAYGYTTSYDESVYYYAYVSDVGDLGYYLTYYVYDYDAGAYVERGSGYIDRDDVTVSGDGLVLNTDTSDIAIIGDGGALVLEWAAAPGGTVSSDSKTKTVTDAYKRISFSGYTQSSSTVEGSFFGDDYVSTGTVQVSKGKQIIQMFD